MGKCSGLWLNAASACRVEDVSLRMQFRATFRFLLCLSLGLGLLLPSASAARRVSGTVQTILILGDSLSDGFGLQRQQAYPALVAEKMRAAGLRYDVINAGLSGGTSSGGLQRIPKYLDRPIDILVLQLGINDVFRGVAVSQIQNNLQSIIDRVEKKNPSVRVVIVGMQLPIPGAEGYVQEFGRMYRALAEKNNAALVPYLLEGVGGDPALNLADRIHPNAAGQRILAENVWRVLEPVVRAKAAENAPATR